MTTVFDFTATTLAGEDKSLKEFDGQALLIVNTASACGFTPQYQGLEQLHKRLSPKGFSVLGFPCNQFGSQEPGDESEIAQFCARNYGVTFPMFAKIDVNGNNAHPLYKFLKSEKGGLLGNSIKWNFTKFVVDRDGRVVAKACADNPAGGAGERDRGPAVNDEPTTKLPDRLCVDPRSPYYDAHILTRDVGIRFKGAERTNVEEYCVSENWIRVAAGSAKDRHGNPVTIKLTGPVEPYFKD